MVPLRGSGACFPNEFDSEFDSARIYLTRLKTSEFTILLGFLCTQLTYYPLRGVSGVAPPVRGYVPPRNSLLNLIRLGFTLSRV